MKMRNLSKKKICGIAGAILAVVATETAFAVPYELNLTTSADLSGIVNGAIFSNPATLSNDVSGTGVFNTFVQIQNSPIEQGYNTSARGGFPTSPPADTNSQTNFDTSNDATHNHDIQLGDVNTLLYNGTVYRQFLLDINEGNNSVDNFLSLDMLQLYISNTPGNFIPNDNQAVLGANNALGTLVYNMDTGANGDSRILLNYAAIGSGSGRPDLQVLIPNNLFLSYASNSYLYLYSRFGDKGCVDSTGATVDPGKQQCSKNYSADYGANSGFEEWGNLTGVSDYCTTNPTDPQCQPPRPPDPPNPPNAPEPGILSLLGLGLLGMAKAIRKKV